MRWLPSQSKVDVSIPWGDIYIVYISMYICECMHLATVSLNETSAQQWDATNELTMVMTIIFDQTILNNAFDKTSIIPSSA